jgi:acylphosphatase
MKKAVKLGVLGTVQGFFFKKFVKDSADKLKITGFIRELESGDIEVIAEGEIETIKDFIANLRKGPPHSQIRDVKVEEKKWTGDYKEFKILKI